MSVSFDVSFRLDQNAVDHKAGEPIAIDIVRCPANAASTQPFAGPTIPPATIPTIDTAGQNGRLHPRG